MARLAQLPLHTLASRHIKGSPISAKKIANNSAAKYLRHIYQVGGFKTPDQNPFRFPDEAFTTIPLPDLPHVQMPALLTTARGHLLLVMKDRTALIAERLEDGYELHPWVMQLSKTLKPRAPDTELLTANLNVGSIAPRSRLSLTLSTRFTPGPGLSLTDPEDCDNDDATIEMKQTVITALSEQVLDWIEVYREVAPQFRKPDVWPPALCSYLVPIEHAPRMGAHLAQLARILSCAADQVGVTCSLSLNRPPQVAGQTICHIEHDMFLDDYDAASRHMKQSGLPDDFFFRAVSAFTPHHPCALMTDTLVELAPPRPIREHDGAVSSILSPYASYGGNGSCNSLSSHDKIELQPLMKKIVELE